MPHTNNRPPDPDSPYTHAPSLIFTTAVSHTNVPVLFEMDSPEAIYFITPVIGPTSTVLMHLLTTWCKQHAEAGNDSFEIGLDELGSYAAISAATLSSTLARLHRFNMIHPLGGTPLLTEVQTTVKHYPVRWLERLPESSRSMLIEWQRILATPAT